MTSNNDSDVNTTASCGFQTPTKRESACVITPPETPSKYNDRFSSRKRQRMVDPASDDSLFLPELGDFDSPARFPLPRSSSTFQIKRRVCILPSSNQLPVMPANFGEEAEESPVLFKLAPRYQRERIMDLASDLSPNKRMKLTPTAQSCLPLIDL